MMQFLTPEVIFTRLVVNELESHAYNMHHLTQDVDNIESLLTQDQWNEVSRHNAVMLQYAAELVASWDRQHTGYVSRASAPGNA